MVMVKYDGGVPTVNWPTFGLRMLYTLYELVQLCLHACNYCPHLNGLSRLVWRSPGGAQCGSFQPCIFQPCHFKKMYYRLAALVNVMPFSPVWEELQPWRWSKNPSPQTNRRPGILRNGDRWANNTSCPFFSSLNFFFFFKWKRKGGRERLNLK